MTDDRAAVFADHCQRLIQDLNSVALQLRTVDERLKDGTVTDEEARAARETVSTTIRRLETYIREAGITMLDLTTGWDVDTDADGPGTARRKPWR
ncbi:hypothetical protein [Nocardia wallacei]|uniref:hypothetical protein n=1 Tax=Nocardia wallacei TaxID=480035 RepID=UPI0024541A42|nr:hypothetical protein [Nocardia wallacei]